MRLFRQAAIFLMFILLIVSASSCIGNNTLTKIINEGSVNTENSDSTDVNIKKKESQFFAMDTVMSIKLYYNDKTDEESVDKVFADLRNMAEYYENLFSVNISDSDINKLNKSGGNVVAVSKETYDIIKKACEFSKETQGLFDITIYPVVKAWGFTTGSHRIPTDEEIKGLLQSVGYENICLKENNQIKLINGALLDLGAIAKGYLSEQMISYLNDTQIVGAVVSLGGCIRTFGTNQKETFMIGITNPTDTVKLAGVVKVKEKAVVTSGGYERFFEKNGRVYHHIMDKRMGKPAESDLLSVTVISDDAAEADVLATTLYIMGKDGAIAYQKQHSDIQLVLIDSENNIWTSKEADFE